MSLAFSYSKVHIIFREIQMIQKVFYIFVAQCIEFPKEYVLYILSIATAYLFIAVMQLIEWGKPGF